MYYIDNYRRRAVEKIIPYLIDFPQIIKIIEANADRYQSVEDLIWQVAESLRLEDARGVWLEAHAYNEGTNFSYTDKATDAFTYGTTNPDYQAYGTGHYYSQTSFASGKKKSLTEEKTIRAVKAKIIQNNTNGNVEDFIEGVKLLYNVDKLKIYESYPFNVSVMLCGDAIELSSTGNYENIKGFLPACTNLKNIYVDPYSFDVYLYNVYNSAYDITRYPVRVGTSTDIYKYISNSITLRNKEIVEGEEKLVNEHISTKQDTFNDKEFCSVVFRPEQLIANSYLLNVSGIDKDNVDPQTVYTDLDIISSNKDLVIVNGFPVLLAGIKQFQALPEATQEAIFTYSALPEADKQALIQFAGLDSATQQAMIAQGLISQEQAQFAIAMGVQNLTLFKDLDRSVVAMIQLILTPGVQQLVLEYGLYSIANSSILKEYGGVENNVGRYSNFSEDNYVEATFPSNTNVEFEFTTGADISGVQNMFESGTNKINMTYSEEKGSYDVSCSNNQLTVSSNYQGRQLDQSNPVKLVQNAYRTYTISNSIELPDSYEFGTHTGVLELENEDTIKVGVNNDLVINVDTNGAIESEFVKMSNNSNSVTVDKHTKIQRNLFSNINASIDNSYAGTMFGLESHNFKCKYDNLLTNSGTQFRAQRNSTDVKTPYYILDGELYRVDTVINSNKLTFQKIHDSNKWTQVSCLFKGIEPDEYEKIYYLGINNGHLYSINYGTNNVELIDDTRTYSSVTAYLYYLDGATIDNIERMHVGLAIANETLVRICTDGNTYAVKEYSELGTCTFISGGSAYKTSISDYCHSYVICDGKMYAFDNEPTQVGNSNLWTYANGETIHDCNLSGAFGICDDVPYKLNGATAIRTQTTYKNWGLIASGTYASLGFADNMAVYIRWTSGSGDTQDTPTTTSALIIPGWADYGYGDKIIEDVAICDYAVAFLAEGSLHFVYLGLGTVFYWCNVDELNKNKYTNLTSNGANGFFATTETGEVHQIYITVLSGVGEVAQPKDCVAFARPCHFTTNWFEKNEATDSDIRVDISQYGITTNDVPTDGDYIKADFTMLPNLNDSNVNFSFKQVTADSEKFTPLIDFEKTTVNNGIITGFSDLFEVPINGKYNYVAFTTGDDIQSQQFVACQNSDLPLINSLFVQAGYFVDLHSVSLDENFNLVYNYTPIAPATPNTTYVLKVPNSQFIYEPVQLGIEGMGVFAPLSWYANKKLAMFCAGADPQYMTYTFKGTCNLKKSYANDGKGGKYKFYYPTVYNFSASYSKTGASTEFAHLHSFENQCKAEVGYGTLTNINLHKSTLGTSKLAIETADPVFRWYKEDTEIPLTRYGLTVVGTPNDEDIITLTYYHLPYSYIGEYELKAETTYTLVFKPNGSSYKVYIRDSEGTETYTNLTTSITGGKANMFKGFKGSSQLTYSYAGDTPYALLVDSWMYMDSPVDPSVYGVQIQGTPKYGDTLSLTFTTGSEINMGIKFVKNGEDTILALEYLSELYYPKNKFDDGTEENIKIEQGKDYTLILNNNNGSLELWVVPRVKFSGNYTKDTSYLFTTINSTEPNLKLEGGFGIEAINDFVINGKKSLGVLGGISNNTYHLISFGKSIPSSNTVDFYGYYPTCYGEKNLLFNCNKNENHLSITTDSELKSHLTTKQNVYNYKDTHSCTRYMYLDNKNSYIEYRLDSVPKVDNVESFELGFEFSTVDELTQCTLISDFVSSNSAINLTPNGVLSIELDTSDTNADGTPVKISYNTDNHFIEPHKYYKFNIKFNAYNLTVECNGDIIADLDMKEFSEVISESPLVLKSKIYGLPKNLYLGKGPNGYYHGILKNVYLDVQTAEYNREVNIPLISRLADENSKYQYVNNGARFVSAPQLINDKTNLDLYGNPLIGNRAIRK